MVLSRIGNSWLSLLIHHLSHSHHTEAFFSTQGLWIYLGILHIKPLDVV